MILTRAIFFIGAILTGTSLLAEDYTEIVKCRSKLLGAPTYSIESKSDATMSERTLRLKKTPLNPTASPAYLETTRNAIIRYGKTFIFTVDEGRSGYAMLYFNDQTSVIDINLFQHHDLNTTKPLTNYHCSFVSSR